MLFLNTLLVADLELMTLCGVEHTRVCYNYNYTDRIQRKAAFFNFWFDSLINQLCFGINKR